MGFLKPRLVQGTLVQNGFVATSYTFTLLNKPFNAPLNCISFACLLVHNFSRRLLLFEEPFILSFHPFFFRVGIEYSGSNPICMGCSLEPGYVQSAN